MPVPTDEFVEEPLVEYQRAFLQRMADLTAHVTDFSEGIETTGARVSPETMTAARIALQNEERRARWSDGETQFVRDESVPEGRVYFAQTPLNPNSVASRIVNDADRLTWSDLARTTGYRALANGEPLTPGTCHNCGATGPVVPRPCTTRECHSQVCIDLCVECVGGSVNSYARLPRGVRPNFVAIDDVDYAMPNWAERQVIERTVDQLRSEATTRSDHYRVTPGQCSCGFRSAFTADMQMHLSGEPSTYIDHPPRYWKLCECGESRLCRRVAVAQCAPVSWTTAEFDATRTPTFTDIYLCDDCCRRRGIS